MCGIAGYWGDKPHSVEEIQNTLDLMKNRGPDNQDYKHIKSKNGKNIYFLHSRLSIIDLDKRSNQPFLIEDYAIVFNGEIYNFIELRKELINKGIKFKTKSDTEVLLQSYIYYGKKCLDYFEGMWSFAIWDFKKNSIFIARDRFGEKPLYLLKANSGIYFSSEIKFIKSLSKLKLDINYDKLVKNLSLGYKSLYKDDELFYKNVYELKASEYLVIGPDKIEKKVNFWKPNIKINQNLSENEAINETKRLLLKSMKYQVRSDVPLAFTLSGGVDSSSICSIAAKELNLKIKTFSIIDSDERYDERDNIKKTIKDLNCEHDFYTFDLKQSMDSLSELENLTSYHEKPISTITSFVQSFLMKRINDQNYKVTFSGTSADELFTGYYDHFLLQLAAISKDKEYLNCLEDWKKNILKFIRNPILKDPNLYIQKPKYRDHIFDGKNEIKDYLVEANDYNFSENEYSKDILKNRMLNELFVEATPVILCESDFNSMLYSVENRSPFLNKELMEFSYSIPSKLLIKNGYGKYILRKSLGGILNDDVRLDRRKRGFNVSINSIVNFEDKSVKEFLLDKESKIFEIVKKDKLENLIKEKNIPNHLSKFLFSVVTTKMFIDKNL